MTRGSLSSFFPSPVFRGGGRHTATEGVMSGGWRTMTPSRPVGGATSPKTGEVVAK